MGIRALIAALEIAIQIDALKCMCGRVETGCQVNDTIGRLENHRLEGHISVVSLNNIGEHFFQGRAIDVSELGSGRAVEGIVSPAAAGGVGVLSALVVGADKTSAGLAAANGDAFGADFGNSAVALGVHEHEIVGRLTGGAFEQLDGLIDSSAVFKNIAIQQRIGHGAGGSEGSINFHVGEAQPVFVHA